MADRPSGCSEGPALQFAGLEKFERGGASGSAESGAGARKRLGSTPAYLLRWHYQPRRRGGPSQAAIRNARSRITDRLDDYLV
jgi:hypothetical protein